MGISLGGLATGLDTKSIVDQLIQIDSRPQIRMQWNKSLWESRKSTWGDLNTRLESLRSFADKLTAPSSWSVFSGVTSADPTKLTGASAGANPASGNHQITIGQLAATEVWQAASALPAATAGTRSTGQWRIAGGANAVAGTVLTALTDQTNTAVGLDNGSTITMRWDKGGSSFSSTFNVTAASTMSDLEAWAQSQIGGGATVALSAGQLDVTSNPGTSSEVTSLSFDARDSAGSVLNRFNGSTGAQSSMTAAATNGGAAASDTLEVTQGASTWYVNVAAGDNEAALINKINATPGIGVVASLNAGKLQLDAKQSGAVSGFTVTSFGPLAATLGLAETTAGQDSAFTVNGTAYTRSKNTGITDVLTDVSLDLLATTGGAVQLTVGTAAATTADMKKRVLDFVNQYNSIVDFVSSKTGESKVINPKNLTEFLQGSMSRDYSFSSTAMDLRRSVNDIVQGLPGGSQMLSDIGITTGGFSATFNSANTTGKLVVDEAKLDAALNADPAKVQAIFANIGGGPTQEKGIARRVSEMVGQWRAGGIVDSSMQGASAQVKALQSSIDRFSDRIKSKRAYYERMFTSMETMVGKMQQQGNWLSGQLSKLS